MANSGSRSQIGAPREPVPALCRLFAPSPPLGCAIFSLPGYLAERGFSRDALDAFGTRGREGDRHGRADTFEALDGQRAAVQFGKPNRQGQPEAGAGVLAD